jgi:S1-C subfamily serine protease
VSSADDLFEALGSLASGAALELTVVRGSEERQISVTPAEEDAA